MCGSVFTARGRPGTGRKLMLAYPGGCNLRRRSEQCTLVARGPLPRDSGGRHVGSHDQHSAVCMVEGQCFCVCVCVCERRWCDGEEYPSAQCTTQNITHRHNTGCVHVLVRNNSIPLAVQGQEGHRRSLEQVRAVLPAHHCDAARARATHKHACHRSIQR